MRTADVVVVGGGPAGIGAALAAAERGARVVLVDEHARPGGQFFKGPAEGFAPTRGRDQQRVAALRARLQQLGVEVIPDAVVWGVFDGRDVMVARDGASERIRAGTVVLATGAYDRPVPFPGWTLPGVMTAGAAQTFVKAQRVLPGRRVLLAGVGPFLLPVARALVDAGAKVLIAEATPASAWLGLVPGALRVPQLVRDAAAYEVALRRARVRSLRRHKVVRALGTESVTGAVVAQVDERWRALPRTERELAVDAVAVGYGFLPSTELAESCGCGLHWDDRAEAWFVAVDERQATTQPGIYAAGEITGIGGWAVAFAEGRAAGAAATGHDEAPPRSLAARRTFAAALNRVFAPRPGLWDGVGGDVVVCRCEEVTAEEIRNRVRDGCTSVKAIKDWTRAGMGLCQGRICASTVTRIVAAETGRRPRDIARGSIRPPIKPVAIDALTAAEVV
jgi:D-hydroxyproline dehydrogenase subunit alpha